MAFDNIGRWEGRRFDQPVGWHIVPATTLHHMIDWAVLREFWNQLMEQRHQAARPPIPNQGAVQRLEEAIVRYLEIAGFEGDPQDIVIELRAEHMHDFRARDLPAHDNLATALCWHRYNLFEGPPPGQHAGQYYRPTHSPDPGQILQVFADLGPNFFDFPIVGPPHGFRANTLYRAYQAMEALNDNGNAAALAGCLNLLEEVCDLEIIPAYDVNWFALLRVHFLALTPFQRQQFFRGCFRYGWHPTEEQIQQAHAQATAI
jgi:hypothetical protein